MHKMFIKSKKSNIYNSQYIHSYLKITSHREKLYTSLPRLRNNETSIMSWRQLIVLWNLQYKSLSASKIIGNAGTTVELMMENNLLQIKLGYWRWFWGVVMEPMGNVFYYLWCHTVEERYFHLYSLLETRIQFKGHRTYPWTNTILSVRSRSRYTTYRETVVWGWRQYTKVW